jgi:hypothetical protein
MPRPSRRLCTTCVASFLRSTPLSTKIAVIRSPTARVSSAATTDESTPPESAQITRSSPTRRRTSATASSRYEAIRQSPRAPHTLVEEVAQHDAAGDGVRDLGVELDAPQPPLGSSQATTGALAVEAVTRKPSGSSRTGRRGSSTPSGGPRGRRTGGRRPRRGDLGPAVLALGRRPRPRRRAPAPSRACRSRCRAPGCRARRGRDRPTVRPPRRRSAGLPRGSDADRPPALDLRHGRSKGWTSQ